MAAESPSRGPEPDLPDEDGAAYRAPTASPAGSETTSTSEMQQLRRLLVGPEQEQLDTVRRRLDALDSEAEQIERVSQVLPQAIALRAADGDQLAKALEPTIEQTLKRSVQRNPKPLVDALFPVIGPAIRRGIREALGQLLASINQTLEHSLSPRSLRWRFEAWRTTQSFAEIVLRNTLLYRVEQLFLIDRTTGLPLLHVHADAVEAQDSALVSGMMTAIQDFVQDSFGEAGGGSLETLRVGDLTVWIEPGPEAVLAAVLRGHPSPALREALRDLNETLHLRFRQELAAFDGDTGPFEQAEPLLASGLLAQYREEERRAPSPLLWIVLALLVLLGGVWLFFSLRERQQWETYLGRLDAEPGLVVLDDGWADGRRFVRGLRDPLAAAPEALLPSTGLDADEVRAAWEPYQSLDPAMVARRAARLLEAPPTVSFRVEDGVLIASGTASAAWQAHAQTRAALLGTIARYDGGDVTDPRLQLLTDSLEQQEVQFQVGTPQLAPGQDAALDRTAALVRALLDAAAEAEWTVRIRVAGHASREGSDAFNQTLSQQRAEAMVRLLTERGLPAAVFEAVGTGQPRTDRPEQDEATRAFNRSTAFHVSFPDVR
ncbi:MAG: OmpA family protein [Rhodothermaceae bacterium]|nr:OmpA family protein [Rhodothermaceae bacterium]